MRSNVTEIAPGLFQVRMSSDVAHLLNVYLWRGVDGVTIIDTGWPGSGPQIASALQDIGQRTRDVRRVVLTHFHRDHTGSLAEVAGWSDAEVVVGRGDADIVEFGGDGPAPRLTEAERNVGMTEEVARRRPTPVPVTRRVDDGDALGADAELAVLAVGGHTDGSIAVHLPAVGALLTGDTAAEFDGEVIVGPFNRDRRQSRDALTRLSSLPVEILGFGHGSPVLCDGADRLGAAGDPFA